MANTLTEILSQPLSPSELSAKFTNSTFEGIVSSINKHATHFPGSFTEKFSHREDSPDYRLFAIKALRTPPYFNIRAIVIFDYDGINKTINYSEIILDYSLLANPNQLMEKFIENKDKPSLNFIHKHNQKIVESKKFYKILFDTYLTQKGIDALFSINTYSPSTQRPADCLRESIEVLVIDDYVSYQESHKKLLIDAGYLAENIYTSSGRDNAMGILRKSGYNISIVISDIDMGNGEDGIFLQRNIRKGLAGEHYRNIPFIFVSGNCIKSTVEQAKNEGASSFISKGHLSKDPYLLPHLVDIVICQGNHKN